MKVKIYTDDYLLSIIDQEDRRLFAEGKSLSARQFQAVAKTCERIGHVFTIGMAEDQLTSRLRELSKRFFRPKDGGTPSLFTGLTMHLGLPFQVNVPIIFGSVEINPFEHTDAIEWQLIRLNSNKSELEICLSQVCDVWDIGTLLSEIDGKTRLQGREGEFFDLAAFHLMAAVATLSRGFASKGAVQSALISAELAIKCSHLRDGKTETWLQNNVGHKLEVHLEKLANFFGRDYEIVREIVSLLPPMVAERYGRHKMEAAAVSDCVLAAQAVLAAVARSVSGSGYRDHFRKEGTASSS